jgi:hypothetical protein
MSQCADNFHFYIRAWDGHHDFNMLELCLKVAMAGATATYWSSDGKCLILYWHEPERMGPEWPAIHPFLAPLDYKAAEAVVRSWLKTADHGPEPDHDGSNSKGWRIFNDAGWNQVGGCNYGICGIEPAWLMHGK